MKTSIIHYAGCDLEVLSFITENDLWPMNMSLDDWPTFCGAGQGFGDFIVPDHICGVNIAPACLPHDLAYALLERTNHNFIAANWQLRKNLRSLTDSKLQGIKREEARIIGDDYFIAVMTFGWPCFTPDATVDTWQESKIVKDRLHRLALADLGVVKN